MPEENIENQHQAEEPTSSDAPITAYSAADAFNHLEQETQAQAHTEGEDIEAPTEAEQQEDSAEEDQEPDTDEAESDDEAEDIPQLDPLLEELAKGNPKAEKRVQEIAKGLQKLKTETKELKSELEKAKPQVSFLQDWNSVLADPHRAGKALEQLVNSVAKHHNLNPEQLLPQTRQSQEQTLLPETDEFGHSRAMWERQGYGSQKEAELGEALRRVQTEMASFRLDREQMQKERHEAAKQAEFKNFVEDVAPKTIRKLEKLENGWKVTKQMVEKAITDFPQLKGEPARAVKAAYPDELKKHHIEANSAKGKTRGPEMPADARGRGEQIPDPRRYGAADALRMVGGA